MTITLEAPQARRAITRVRIVSVILNWENKALQVGVELGYEDADKFVSAGTRTFDVRGEDFDAACQQHDAIDKIRKGLETFLVGRNVFKGTVT